MNTIKSKSNGNNTNNKNGSKKSSTPASSNLLNLEEAWKNLLAGLERLRGTEQEMASSDAMKRLLARQRQPNSIRRGTAFSDAMKRMLAQQGQSSSGSSNSNERGTVSDAAVKMLLASQGQSNNNNMPSSLGDSFLDWLSLSTMCLVNKCSAERKQEQGGEEEEEEESTESSSDNDNRSGKEEEENDNEHVSDLFSWIRQNCSTYSIPAAVSNLPSDKRPSFGRSFSTTSSAPSIPMSSSAACFPSSPSNANGTCNVGCNFNNNNTNANNTNTTDGNTEGNNDPSPPTGQRFSMCAPAKWSIDKIQQTFRFQKARRVIRNDARAGRFESFLLFRSKNLQKDASLVGVLDITQGLDACFVSVAKSDLPPAVARFYEMSGYFSGGSQTGNEESAQHLWGAHVSWFPQGGEFHPINQVSTVEKRFTAFAVHNALCIMKQKLQRATRVDIKGGNSSSSSSSTKQQPFSQGNASSFQNNNNANSNGCSPTPKEGAGESTLLSLESLEKAEAYIVRVGNNDAMLTIQHIDAARSLPSVKGLLKDYYVRHDLRTQRLQSLRSRIADLKKALLFSSCCNNCNNCNRAPVSSTPTTSTSDIKMNKGNNTNITNKGNTDKCSSNKGNTDKCSGKTMSSEANSNGNESNLHAENKKFRDAIHAVRAEWLKKNNLMEKDESTNNTTTGATNVAAEKGANNSKTDTSTGNSNTASGKSVSSKSESNTNTGNFSTGNTNTVSVKSEGNKSERETEGTISTSTDSGKSTSTDSGKSESNNNKAEKETDVAASKKGRGGSAATLNVKN